MISNKWEEQSMDDVLLAFHEEEVTKFGLPSWANVKCPFCNRDLPRRSIRSVGLKLNTRNMGDVVVEVFCDDCSKMDTLYFRGEADTIEEFTLLLMGQRWPESSPIVEEKMYKMQYNNVLEKMVKANVSKEDNNDNS